MSGLADPVPVIQILTTDPHITALYELRTVSAVADGVQGAGHLDTHRESVKQAAVADTLVISKTDVADVAMLDALASRLAAINPGARQFRVAQGDIEPAHILAQSGFDVAARSDAARGWLNDGSYAVTVAPASADPAIPTFALTYDNDTTLPGFVLWMNLPAGFRGAGLLRVKGIGYRPRGSAAADPKAHPGLDRDDATTTRMQPRQNAVAMPMLCRQQRTTITSRLVTQQNYIALQRWRKCAERVGVTLPRTSFYRIIDVNQVRILSLPLCSVDDRSRFRRD
jgi:G3E family GTPase